MRSSVITWFPPGILQSDRQIEYRPAWHMIDPVGDKVPMALELELVVRLGMGQGGLDDGAHYLQAVGVQAFDEVFAAGVRVRVQEQAVVHAPLGAHAVG